MTPGDPILWRLHTRSKFGGYVQKSDAKQLMGPISWFYRVTGYMVGFLPEVLWVPPPKNILNMVILDVQNEISGTQKHKNLAF